jgi:release factor glutamine methyltransferase
MIHKLLKILSPVLQPLLRFYLRKPRKYRYNDLSIMVEPGVFYPGFVLSTKLLLDFLDEKALSGKAFLELGAGCGIISLVAARKSALVTASDINPVAVENIKHNVHRNKLTIRVFQSDLFENINGTNFDWIVINPPYYQKDPKDFSEMAWFCGKDFDYFEKLFPQLSNHITPSTETIMILSEDCNIDRIQEIAKKSGFGFQIVKQVQRMGEWNYIFRIQKKTGEVVMW